MIEYTFVFTGSPGTFNKLTVLKHKATEQFYSKHSEMELNINYKTVLEIPLKLGN